jgi:hypothetical protein
LRKTRRRPYQQNRNRRNPRQLNPHRKLRALNRSKPRLPRNPLKRAHPTLELWPQRLAADLGKLFRPEKCRSAD